MLTPSPPPPLELWAMDDKKAPQDKLNCISKCCMTLLSALRLSQEGPASADEFLPSLIFMIIYTSPQHFHSNIKYVLCVYVCISQLPLYMYTIMLQ